MPGKESWIRKMQLAAKKTLGFTIPLIHARGVFNYDVGLMPYRHEINTVGMLGASFYLPYLMKCSGKTDLPAEKHGPFGSGGVGVSKAVYRRAAEDVG
jgi:hypothetical protein